MNKNKPYWYPTLAGPEYYRELRKDYPEHAKMSDEQLLEYYNQGRRYVITWDHVNDAYDDYQRLADEFLELEWEMEKLKND